MQFLPTYNPLVAEAVEQAVGVEFGSAPTRVMRAEHLAAVMLQTGRPKDHARLVGFLDEGVVDRGVLEEVLTRHALTGKWREFLGKFYP